VDRVHIGTTFRAIRLELGLRQADVAARARVCQQTVSKVERGKFGALSTDALFAIADAIEADLLLAVRWRGPKLARLLDRRHAQMQIEWCGCSPGRAGKSASRSHSIISGIEGRSTFLPGAEICTRS
jgi:transcriptional regulator with XRE-family HTH domain